jgi:hypothetical protein
MTKLPDDLIKTAVSAFEEVAKDQSTPSIYAILFIHAARIIRELRPDLRFDP